MGGSTKLELRLQPGYLLDTGGVQCHLTVRHRSASILFLYFNARWHFFAFMIQLA